MSTLVDCPVCGGKVSTGAYSCPHCGEPNSGGAPLRVVVRDFDLSFGSMVSLMVRFAIAAIPAFIILSVLAVIIYVVFVALGISR